MSTITINWFVWTQKELNKTLLEIEGFDVKNFTDGYHTFEELYEQRAMLYAFVVSCRKRDFKKSYLHSDFTFFEWMFIVQWYVDIYPDYKECQVKRQISFHIKNEYRDYFQCQEVAKADIRDWHTSYDVIDSLKTLLIPG